MPNEDSECSHDKKITILANPSVYKIVAEVSDSIQKKRLSGHKIGSSRKFKGKNNIPNEQYAPPTTSVEGGKRIHSLEAFVINGSESAKSTPQFPVEKIIRIIRRCEGQKL